MFRVPILITTEKAARHNLLLGSSKKSVRKKVEDFTYRKFHKIVSLVVLLWIVQPLCGYLKTLTYSTRWLIVFVPLTRE